MQAEFSARRVNHRPRPVQDVAAKKRGELVSGARLSLGNTEVDLERPAAAAIVEDKVGFFMVHAKEAADASAVYGGLFEVAVANSHFLRIRLR